MSTQLDALPHRHVLTLPSEPSVVRSARVTAEKALVEFVPTGEPAEVRQSWRTTGWPDGDRNPRAIPSQGLTNAHICNC